MPAANLLVLPARGSSGARELFMALMWTVTSPRECTSAAMMRSSCATDITYERPSRAIKRVISSVLRTRPGRSLASAVGAQDSTRSQRASDRRWAALLQQIVEVDPLACPTCHGATDRRPAPSEIPIPRRGLGPPSRIATPPHERGRCRIRRSRPRRTSIAHPSSPFPAADLACVPCGAPRHRAMPT